MDWLEQNIDAYRIIAEILNELREIFRDRLEAIHGKKWFETGLPDGLLDRLIASKEKEKAIDWYESEYQEIITYAVFPDLLEILEHNADSFPQMQGLAPTSALLHARFLELEVMRAKLGRARPISETELSFLGTFHLRFRKAIEEFRAEVPQAAASPPPEDAAPSAPPPEAAVPAETAPEAGAAESPASDAEPFGPLATPPKGQQPPAVEQPAAEAPRRAAQAPTTDAISGGARPEPPLTEAPTAEPPASEAAPSGAGGQVAPAREEPGFEEALDARATPVILRELYKEVTAIAEGIWTKDIPPPARAWEKVSVSPWYEDSFSELGLRPLSDFYEVISKVDKKMRQGVSRDELQSYLKDANFAQVLLALRDMFQRNNI